MGWWSWALGIVSVIATWQAGSRRRWSWLLACGGCGLWGLYGMATKQYGLVLSSGVGAIVCLRNWFSWRKEPERAALSPSGERNPLRSSPQRRRGRGRASRSGRRRSQPRPR